MNKTQFTFETGGLFCCLCLKTSLPPPSSLSSSTLSSLDKVKVEPITSNDDPEDKQEVALPPPQKITSFQKICQYLNIDIKKLFDENSGVPLDSLPALENSIISGTLCGNCAEISKNFTQLYLELEVVQMKLHLCLNSVFESVSGKNNAFGAMKMQLINHHPKKLSSLDVIERLHEQIFSKYKNLHLHGTSMRVVLEERVGVAKIMKQEVFEDGEEDHQSNTSFPYIEEVIPLSFSEVKLEPAFTPTAPEEAKLPSTSPSQHDSRYPSSVPSLNPTKIAKLMSSKIGKATKTIETNIKDNISTRKKQKIGSTHPVPTPTIQRSSLNCNFCSREFTSTSLLQMHVTTNHSHLDTDRKFECEVCKKRFLAIQHLQKHVNKVHGKSRFKCDRCLSTFKTNYGLKRHQDQIDCVAVAHAGATKRRRRRKQTKCEATEIKCLTCNVCKKSFMDFAGLQKHKQCAHLKLQHKCDQCGKSFRRNDYLRDHVNAMHNGKLWNCEFCSATFIYRPGLTRHLRICGPGQGQGQNQPSILNKKIKTGNEADAQVTTVVKCEVPNDPLAEEDIDISNISPTLEDMANAHQQQRQEQKIKITLKKAKKTLPLAPLLSHSHTCKYCQRSFPMAKILRLHTTRFHSHEDKERKFECEICKVRFIRKELLQLHKYNVHTNRRLYCEFCPAKFKTTSAKNIIHLAQNCPARKKANKLK